MPSPAGVQPATRCLAGHHGSLPLPCQRSCRARSVARIAQYTCCFSTQHSSTCITLRHTAYFSHRAPTACRATAQERSRGKAAPPPEPEQTGVPWASIGLWACTLGYWWLFFASKGILPGEPAWVPQPEGVSEILNESINFWYANILFETAGWPAIPNQAQHPVSEAIFNFAGTFSFLMLPLFVYDDKGKRKITNWTAILFLTNFLMWPYMALRADFTHKHKKELEPTPAKVPLWGLKWVPWAPAVSYTAIAIALFSVWWGLFGRPEFGDLPARWEYLKYAITHDRAFDVSISDSICYSLWQMVLMRGAPAKYRFVPYIGLALWLIDIPEQRRVQAAAEQKQAERSA